MTNKRNSKWLAAGTLAAAVASALLAQPALATMHGVCVSPSAPCSDNSTNTPTSDPNVNFTFTISPGPQTGDVLIDVLIPSSDGILANFALSGTQGGVANTTAISTTAGLVSNSPWNSGQLDSYLGFSASPTNPIGAFIGGSFYVYQADLGVTQLWDNSNAASGPQMALGAALPTGAYIVGFLEPVGSKAWDATANSGAIFETGQISTVPEPATLGLLGLGLAAIGMARRKAR